MKPEVGGKYKSRNGDIKTIVKFVDGSRFPYKSEDGASFTNKGEYLGGEPHGLDLIEEVEEEIVEKVVDKPLFEVGKEYTTSSGRKARIFSYHENQLKPYIGEYENSQGEWFAGRWHSNGKMTVDYTMDADLVPPEPEIEISDAVWQAYWSGIGKKDGPVPREKSQVLPCMKAAIKAYLAEQKEVGKKDIV